MKRSGEGDINRHRLRELYAPLAGLFVGRPVVVHESELSPYWQWRAKRALREARQRRLRRAWVALWDRQRRASAEIERGSFPMEEIEAIVKGREWLAGPDLLGSISRARESRSDPAHYADEELTSEEYVLYEHIVEEFERLGKTVHAVPGRLARLVATLTLLTGAIGALVAFRNQVESLIADLVPPFREFRVTQAASTLRREVEALLSVGALEQARSKIRKASSDSDSVLGKAPEGRAAGLLVESLGGERDWDAINDQEREDLLSDITKLRASELSSEVCSLLVYRLYYVGRASQFFRAREKVLHIPYIRMLAGREAFNSDPTWATQVLIAVRDTSRSLGRCGLEREAVVCIAKAARIAGDSAGEAAAVLSLRQLESCRDGTGTGAEAEYWGTRLQMAARSGDVVTAFAARARLEELAQAGGEPDARLKATFWLAWDSYFAATGTADTNTVKSLRKCQVEAAEVEALCQSERRLAIRNGYYCADATKLAAFAAMGLADSSERVELDLENARRKFSGLSTGRFGGPYFDDEADAALGLAALHARRGAVQLARWELGLVDSLWRAERLSSRGEGPSEADRNLWRQIASRLPD